MSTPENITKLMATMVDQDGSLVGQLEVEVPDGAKPGDVFELECMAQVASVTTTIEGMPDRMIMHFYEMKLDKNDEWTPPEPVVPEIPLVEPPMGAMLPTPPPTEEV